MSKPAPVANQPELRRVIGPGLLLLFIVGDVLGTGVYALTGKVAAEVGGAAWLPFLIAFFIAAITAFSYLELVTKYPQAAGAALYAHKAFGKPFVTFLVAFVVMCSGITSASTASRTFAANFEQGLVGLGIGPEWGTVGVAAVALVFMGLLAAVNLRGVSESVKLNVGLTIIEISGLMMVILVGVWAFTRSVDVDFSRIVAFETASDKSVFMAVTASTALAFFAMVGFEDSVNMAEETKDPVRIFPRILLSGLTIAGVVYVLVSIVAVALVPIGELKASETPLVDVVKAGAPGLPIEHILPFISMFAVSNTALINMLMASRLIYGMARQHVLPPVLGRVHPRTRTPWVAIIFTTVIAFGLIIYVTAVAGEETIRVLGATTALLLLAVFAVVNVAVLVLRRDLQTSGRHFTTPTALPVIGFISSLYLVIFGHTWAEYSVALLLLGIGVLLFFVTMLINRRLGVHTHGIVDPTELAQRD
ncbi:amino acid permease family protein [Mycolicibacterium hassiacum DSM 44199]|jgi:amino acid transporter|uniref:Amino acid permease family protein n=1 Tax=Mycolicibacterium hassiacum (strain DSM 44199 / CIP 105218 / JCM 12690 / 3849) TaxID=1122247 RepID=K5BDN1_MYCHD|nr:APC family permease [Mycolicibacterium hassiacum]EKF22262.1 amino acid permease family protein [Mycolicibacterium hassiacum DSM 44199]MBX5486161.1 APC family permease [Mycolicibacterium hassiacum]MDA4087466.1 amino acid permease [Mycolicibacterium hassiacum DSM 44199]VCT91910.1 putative amino acid permease YhdG [Mycolicibacterium hassiacum DSM 44199]